MATIIYEATAPDGSKHYRTSSSGRTYTHAVLTKGDHGWSIGSCAGDQRMANDRLAEFNRHRSAENRAVLVPVITVERKPKAGSAPA